MSNEIMTLKDAPVNSQFSSFVANDIEDKKRLYNSISFCDSKAVDLINKEIMLKDVVMVKVELTPDRNTKGNSFTEEAVKDNKEAIRVILLDESDKAYSAVSNGMFNAVMTIFNIFGTLHFEPPMKVTVKQIETKNGRTLTLQL